MWTPSPVLLYFFLPVLLGVFIDKSAAVLYFNPLMPGGNKKVTHT